MSDATEHDPLIVKAVNGDADALESLLLGHFDRLAATVTPRIPEDVRGAISAEDVVQEAFVVAFERISTFEPRGRDAFFAWISRIAENRLMDAVKALRAAKRGGGRRRVSDGRDAATGDLIPIMEMLSAHSRSPSRSAAAHDATAALDAALAALDADYRDVLRLRYIESLPVAACAERMQRSEGAIHMLLGRALAALRQRMGDSARFLTRKP